MSLYQIKHKAIHNLRILLHIFRNHLDDHPLLRDTMVKIINRMPHSARIRLFRLIRSSRPQFTVRKAEELSRDSRLVYDELKNAIAKREK